MAEPIKVNAYYIVSSFGTEKERWRVLSDGRICIIVKPEDTFLVNEERGLYSVTLAKQGSATILEGNLIHSIMIHSDRHITIIRQGDKDDSNKQNVAKI